MSYDFQEAMAIGRAMRKRTIVGGGGAAPSMPAGYDPNSLGGLY
jgi:hypothetical protein